MVQSIEIAPIQEAGSAPTWYAYIIRGRLTTGEAFVHSGGNSTLEDTEDDILSDLATNATNWGIYNDVT
jgi:hypothetical protein